MTTWLRLLKLVNACDAAALSPVLLSAKGIQPARKVEIMFIVLQHRITNPATAFTRGQNLLDGNGVGDSSENSYFEVDVEIARGLPRLVGA